MIKKLLFIAVCLSMGLSAQEKDPAVELPRFVITGSQTFSFPAAEKKAPALVSILSDEFLTPVYAPTQLEVKEMAENKNPEVRFSDSLNYRNALFSLSMGNISLPSAKLITTFPSESSLFHLRLFADNRTDYIENAGKFTYGLGARFDHFVKHNADFMPGAEISLSTNFQSDDYKFFGSSNPESERNSTAFDIGFAMENLLSKNVTYGIDLNYSLLSVSDSLGMNPLGSLFPSSTLLLSGDHDESNFAVDGYLNFLLSSFELQTDVHFVSQSFTNPYFDFSGNNFYAVRGVAGFDISKVLKVQGGFEYSAVDSLSKFNPIARMVLQVNRYFSVIGEFAPSTEFLTIKNLFNGNPYYYPLRNGYVFFEKENALSAALKYEYSRFFEISGGLKYYRSDRHPFYSEDLVGGFYDVFFTEADFWGAFVHLLFHPGPNGVLYAEIDLQNVSDKNGNTLPYYPDLDIFISYGYQLSEEIELKPILKYRSSVYTDRLDSLPLDGYLDAGLHGTYSFSDDFAMRLELNNLLNQSVYHWRNYEEPAMNFQVGIEYRR